MLLRGPVVESERERRVGRGGDEREVDDPPHARRHRRVHRGDVLGDPVGGLGRRDEEEHVGARERGEHSRAVGVAASRHAHLGAFELRGAGGVAHDEALTGGALGQPAGDA